MKATMRTMRAAILLACACAASVTCGPRSDAPADGPWPISTGSPGVLGYIALPAEPDDIAEACRQALTWSPGGLSDHAPASLLLLDRVVFGGPLALALPIDDEAAFRSSLEQCPLIRHVRGDAWVIALSGDHPVLTFLRFAEGYSASQSMVGRLASVSPRRGVEWAVELVIEDGWAIMGPSIEAGLATQRVLDKIPGFGVRDGPIVASLDAQRFHLAYQTEIEAVVNTARGMLSGMQMAGLAGMLAQMKGGSHGGAVPGLPLGGPTIWALLEMLSIDEIEGAQIVVHGGDVGALVAELSRTLGTSREDGSGPTEGHDASIDLRLVWAAGSRPAQLLAAQRPVAEMPGGVAVGFDPDLFPEALAQWARPLVELTMGEGQPAERLMARIAELLAPCGGTAMAGLADGGQALALLLRPGQELDVDGMIEIFELFAHALDLDVGLDDVLPLSELTSSSGLIPAGIYWHADGVFYLTLGDCAPEALDQLAMHTEQAAAVPRSVGFSPFLVLHAGEARMKMYAERDELLIELPLVIGLDR